eukprot:SAG31_NODE_7634_length_1634_cov_1.302932_2_plen_161_part_00
MSCCNQQCWTRRNLEKAVLYTTETHKEEVRTAMFEQVTLGWDRYGKRRGSRKRNLIGLHYFIELQRQLAWLGELSGDSAEAAAADIFECFSSEKDGYLPGCIKCDGTQPAFKFALLAPNQICSAGREGCAAFADLQAAQTYCWKDQNCKGVTLNDNNGCV